MQQFKKQFSLFTAALVFAASYGRIMPSEVIHATGNIRTALEFSDALRTSAAPTAEPFQELRFDAEKGMLYRDGKPVGTEYAGFRITDGRLTFPDAMSGGSVQQDTGLNADQAVKTMGCEITKNGDGDLVIRSPFQTARLIVRSDHAVDLYGGSIAAEGFRGLHVIQYETAAQAYSAYLAFQNDSRIAFVQPDRLYYQADPEPVSEEPPAEYDRTMQVKSWGYEAIGTESYLSWLDSVKPELPEIKVALLDTGIYAEHEWFTGRIAAGGIDLAPGSVSSTNDGQGHGTHCAGIICQNTPDSVKILPVKVLSDEGYGSDMSVYCGILYAVEQKADVINMSLGGDGEGPLLKEALHTALEDEITCCVAAGNDSEFSKYYAPACYDEVITVSALSLLEANKNEGYPVSEWYQIAAFSNFGSTVDFTAPGDVISSAFIGSKNAVQNLSGTSMAAPFATAACADLLCYQPELTNQEIYDLLKNNAIRLPQPENVIISAEELYGNGLINLDRIFEALAAEKLPALTFRVNDITTSRLRYDFDEPVTVTFSCEADDAKIYYTTDHTVPSPENGTLLGEKPVLIEKSTVVQAIACKNGSLSPVCRLRFQIGDDDVADPYIIENGVLKGYRGVKTDVNMLKNPPPETVTEIADEAFFKTDIITLRLPESVTKIGDRAFKDSLLQFIVGDGVNAVGRQTFMNCSELYSVSFQPLKEAGNGAFAYCHRFPDLKFDDSFTEIPDNLFNGFEGDIQDSINWEKVTKIGSHAFEKASYPETVHLDSLQSLGESAFADAFVREVYLPDTITELPDYAFGYCQQVRKFHANGLRKIGLHALPMLESWTNDPDADDKMDIQISFDKIEEMSGAGLYYSNIPEPVSFDSLTKISPDSIFGTTGETLIFPKLTEVLEDCFGGPENLIWLPNAEAVKIISTALNGLRVSEKLKSLEILNSENVKYLIGPADSAAESFAAEYRIPFYTPGSLTIENTTHSVIKNQALLLQATYIQDPDTEISWCEVVDGKEIAFGDDKVTILPKKYDLSKCVLVEHPTETGLHVYRAKLMKDGALKASADVTVSVGTDIHTDEPKTPAPQTGYHIWDSTGTDTERVLTPGSIADFDEAMGNGKFIIYSDHKCRVSLKALNKNVQITGIIRSYNYPIGYPVSETSFADLESGFSQLTLLTADNTSAFKTPLVFQLVEKQNSIMSAEIIAEDAVETGAEIVPKYRVTCSGELLEEGVDYRVRYQDAPKAAGIYRLKIVGCGTYFDEVQTSFRVLPKPEADKTALTVGTHTVQPEAGHATVFSWVPDQTDYCLVKTSLPNSVLNVQTADGTYVDGCSGVGYQYQTLHVEAGKPYLVSVSNEYAEESNPVTFELLSDFRLLDDCDIQIPKLNQLGKAPEVTIKDGDTALVQDTDYRILALDSPKHLGLGVAYIQGSGKYVGDIMKTFVFYSPDPTYFPDLDEESMEIQDTELIADQDMKIPEGVLPGEAAVFRFTAQSDGIYHLTAPEPDKKDVTILIYTDEAEPILVDTGEADLELQNDQEIRIVVIGNFIRNYPIHDYTNLSKLCITKTESLQEYEADGFKYRIRGNQAVITELHPEDNILRLPEKINLDDWYYPVKMPDPVLLAPYVDSLIILTESQDLLHAECERLGYFVIRTDSETTVEGDVSGDEQLSYQDAYILQCWLSERAGVELNAFEQKAADCNQDGIINMMDVQAILQRIEPPAPVTDSE